MSLTTQWGVPRGQTSNYQTLLTNGPMEIWSDTAAIADGWLYEAQNSETPTLLRVAGTRTSGFGSYFQRITYAAPAAGSLCKIAQEVYLKRHDHLNAGGVDNMIFLAQCWARDGAAASRIDLQISINEHDADGVGLTGTSNTRTPLSTNWSQNLHTHTVTNDNTAMIRVVFDFDRVNAGGSIIEMDEAELYTGYTFARNPASPATADFSVAHRKFKRTIDGSLYLARPKNQSAKIERTLPFRGIGLAQVKSLRGLWLLDVPLRWVPNEPTLPAVVFCRITDMTLKFRLMRAGWSDNLYSGSITLSEV